MSDETQEDFEAQSQIPRFEFTNGRGEKGWAEFVDLDDLTRRDIKFLRKAVGTSENEGEATNNFMDEALRILVLAWEVPGRPDVLLPRLDKTGKTTDSIPATFSAALEKHFRPYLMKLTRGEVIEEGEPGSPRQRGRA